MDQSTIPRASRPNVCVKRSERDERKGRQNRNKRTMINLEIEGRKRKMVKRKILKTKARKKMWSVMGLITQFSPGMLSSRNVATLLCQQLSTWFSCDRILPFIEATELRGRKGLYILSIRAPIEHSSSLATRFPLLAYLTMTDR